jgi:hypothetical protein
MVCIPVGNQISWYGAIPRKEGADAKDREALSGCDVA